MYGMFSFGIFPMGSCPALSRGYLGPYWAHLGPHGPGPHGAPWAFVGQALERPPWALMGRALEVPSMGWALAGPPGPLWARWPVWAGPLWAHWARAGRALMAPPGPLRAGPLWAPWGRAGQALVGFQGPSPAGP